MLLCVFLFILHVTLCNSVLLNVTLRSSVLLYVTLCVLCCPHDLCLLLLLYLDPVLPRVIFYCFIVQDVALLFFVNSFSFMSLYVALPSLSHYLLLYFSSPCHTLLYLHSCCYLLSYITPSCLKFLQAFLIK